MTSTAVRRTAAVAAATALIAPAAAFAVPAPDDVIVRNPKTSPVFTEVVNTPEVTVTGTPSVTVQGTPTVAVVPPALVQHEALILLDNGEQAGSQTLFTVPAGKEFRLSFVTAALLSDPSKGALIRLRNGVGSGAFDARLLLERYESALGDAGFFDFGLSEPVNMIWGPGEIVDVVANRADGAFERTARVVLVGELVDAAG